MLTSPPTHLSDQIIDEPISLLEDRQASHLGSRGLQLLDPTKLLAE
jgi:hypothetical protein